MPQLNLTILGAFQVHLDGQRLTNFHSVKVQALLAYLALEADRPQPRETLATLLWPLDSETSARNSLRQALYELRKLLGDRDDSPVPFLLVTRQTVQFNRASDHTIDVADFLMYLKDGRLAEAATCYRGELLSGLSCESEPFEEWLRQTRTHLHSLTVDLFFRLAEQKLSTGDFSQARSFAERQLGLEPWREEAHRQLMTALALDGERSAALAHYEICRRILADELGVEPDEETTTLYEAIKAGKLRGAGASPLPISKVLQVGSERSAPRHNLPPQSTPFIGRKTDLEQITTRLHDPTCRLLTIVGPGGMGKTRLALQAAQSFWETAGTPNHHSQATMPEPKLGDGVFFVALAGVGSPDLLVSAIVAALDLTFYGSGDLKTQLFDYLKTHSMLLLLDNFEHLLAGVELVSELLTAAPGLKLLVTSREALNLQEEWLFPLSGLRVPSETRYEGAEALVTYSAVQLFSRCAQRVQPEFDLALEGDAVVHICRLVDGMPLGIELAAAWCKLFPCGKIAQEMARNLDFLATSLRNVPVRHRSMRAVFEHSWQLMTAEEQQVFARLAVFRGGFQQEAAQQVSAADLPVLRTLVEKSLLQVTPAQRFQLHELLRQFGEEKLQTSPQVFAQTQARHGIYYLSFLQQQEAQLKGRAHKIAMTSVETEIENIRVGWQWAVANCHVDAIDSALEGLFFFYFAKSWWQEGEIAFERAAEALATAKPVGTQGLVWGKILAKQAFINLFVALELGNEIARKRVEALCQQSLTVLHQLGQHAETALALSTLSSLYYTLYGKFAEGFDLAQQALLLFIEKGDQWGTIHSFSSLGFVSYWMGNYRLSIDYFKQGIALCEERGDPITLGDLLNCMGEAYKALGEYAEARQAAQIALAVRDTAGDKRGIAFSLELLGEVAWHTGDYAMAQQHAQASLELFQSIGLVKASEIAHNTLGKVAYSLGDHQQARAYFHAVLEPNAREDMLYIYRQVPEALTGIAAMQAKEGRQAQAAELLHHVFSHPAAWQETKDWAQRLLAELATELPPQLIVAAQAQAAAQNLTTIVAVLLAEFE